MHHKAVTDTLNQVIEESGLWQNGRRSTHGFFLSPSVYRISAEKCAELNLLGRSLSDCLLGLSHIAVIAYDTALNYRGAWMLARQVFSTGVPKVYQELQGMNVKHIPKLLKVDTMIDSAGRIRIAEIDGHNKHGLGYSALCRRFRDALRPNAHTLPGIIQMLAAEIKSRGESEVKLFYADQERFYVPEFEVAAQEFRKEGIECLIIPEMEAESAILENGLFLDLPFLYHRTSLYDVIIAAYKRGSVQFVIPPKPCFGAKGVMALLRNDGGDPELEALLRSFIKKESLELVRGYIPETLLVGKHATRAGAVRERLSAKKYVLKESVSSGMKGVYFSEDEDFEQALLRAEASSMNWVLQERVENQAQTFSWIGGEGGNGSGPEILTSGGWYMRVIAQYVGRKLADIIITARRDHAVHGGKDCIQLGTIIEQ